jgi:hypothetical protein
MGSLPKPSYIFSFVYGWAFPAMVPMFAILFGLINTRVMWSLEHFFYSKNASDTYLFKHFDRLKLEGMLQTSYRAHPFFAGIALLLSYWLMYTMNDVRSYQHTICAVCYVLSSSLMAYWGSKLVPTMYGNALAKKWTLMQSQIVLGYNLVLVLALIANSRFLENIVIILSLSLLICAGIFERGYVLFVLPLCGFPVDTAEGEKSYRQWYSIQFKAATIASWFLGSALLLRYRNELDA